MICICASASGTARQETGTAYIPRHIQPNERCRSRHCYLSEPSKDAFNNPTRLGGCCLNHLPRCVFIAFHSISVRLPVEDIKIDSRCFRKGRELLS